MRAPSKRIAACCLLAAAAGLSGSIRTAAGAEIVVAAAADLAFALEEIAGEFSHHTGHRVKLSFGSSGNLYAQVRAGAPFDLFLSADSSHARSLEAAGLAERGSTFVYGYGQLVLWVPNASSLDLQGLGMKALGEASVRKVAIANPRHAPYGRAAIAALEKLGLYEAVRPKLVFGESVQQAAQFVETGAADVGIIARALAAAPPMLRAGRMRMVPPELHPRIEQAGAIVRRRRAAEVLAATRSLADWIRGPRGRNVLERYGFTLPPAPEAR